jgi:hypothetical protein
MASGSKPGKKPPKGSGTPQPPRSATPSSPSGSGGSTSSSKKSAPPGASGSVDVSVIAGAVGLGFTILVFGGLLQPVATTFIPQSLSQFWVMFVAVVAFAVAGVRAGMTAPNPPLYGAGSAVGSYLIAVPLQFLQASFNPLYAVYTVVGAAVIGALAALVATRFRRSRTS